MFDGLPHSAHSIINNDEWHGGSIVRLDSALCRPAAADVAINYHMLKPVITHSPDKACKRITTLLQVLRPMGLFMFVLKCF